MKNSISLIVLMWAMSISFSSLESAVDSTLDAQPQNDEINALLADLNCDRIIYDGKTLKVIKEPSWIVLGSGALMTALTLAVSNIKSRENHIFMSRLFAAMGIGLGVFTVYLMDMKLRKTSYILFDELGVSVNNKRVCKWSQVSRTKVVTIVQGGSVNHCFCLLDKKDKELFCEVHSMLPVQFNDFVKLVKTFMLKKAKIKFY